MNQTQPETKSQINKEEEETIFNKLIFLSIFILLFFVIYRIFNK